MSNDLLTVAEASRLLGITATTLYDWLSQSDYGLFVLRGQPVTVNYLQGGARGQGRIRIEASEVERLKQLMRVVPQHHVPRRPIIQPQNYPGINVPLGRPGQR